MKISVHKNDHLTATNKKAIKALFEAGIMCGKVDKVTYRIEEVNVDGYQYRVTYQQKDRGLIPCPGSKVRISTYTALFNIK